MTAGTLHRYFARRFTGAVLATFAGVFLLVAMIDYVELMRYAGDNPNASAALVAQMSLFRVPQVTERVIPFCIMVGTMAAYLSLSRRLELVVARAAGVSAWQFVGPAVVAAFLLGLLATALYNPLSAALHEQSKRIEAAIFGERRTAGLQQAIGGSFWVTQRGEEGQAILNARVSLQQGADLRGVTVFQFDANGRFRERVEATSAVLESGYWRLQDAKIYASGVPARGPGEYLIATRLTRDEVREHFAIPETLSIWELPEYIDRAERSGFATAGYRLHFHKLIARPFLLAAMVLLAAAFSLRFFRFGGVQKMVLGGVISGFVLYVASKVLDDLSKADLLHPVAAAWLPVVIGGMTGIVALLYQEDG
jgi:lipopolysaccharide export system permease protein